ncbi:hypothetical protein KO481_40115 [Nocardia sp. NEAU-G5]|uniref:Uncharacterized protein n=1 Tax=Nocardia albiluteola TaxID=2842303 RepID=A0ABS6BBP7_9NOCA|nr:hypothetical protein [Nocardia albiluteola]MBU3067712.1 hypothetical protein [Nocardia albiluteola]
MTFDDPLQACGVAELVARLGMLEVVLQRKKHPRSADRETARSNAERIVLGTNGTRLGAIKTFATTLHAIIARHFFSTL